MTVVLLCEERVPEIEPQGWLPDANVAIVPDLCRRPGEIGRLAHGASHLVLGVCPGEYSLGAIQTQARRVGLDALGVELVDLRSAEGDAERLRLIVAGAVSRARAFGGSRPEHAKLCFPADLSRRSLLTLSLPEYLAVPLADESLCAADTGCRACVDACPRGALTWRNGRVATDKVTCEPCGLCVGSCPTGAMVSPTETPAQIEAQIRALLDAAIGPLGPRGIVFTCRRAPRVETAPGWFPVTLPCAGMAPPAWILAPLLMGAGAEGIRPCGDTGCPLGNDETIVERVAYCRKVLGLLGLSENRVTTDPAGAPQKEGPAVDLEDPFGPLGSAEVLAGLAELSGVVAPPVLEHPRSPVGTIEIREEVCTACTMCAQSCPTGALAQEHEEQSVVVTFDGVLCVGCGQCLRTCPEEERGAIVLSRKTDFAVLNRGRTLLLRDQTTRCTSCGSPIAPKRMMERIEELLGSEHAATLEVLNRYCLDCRGRPVADERVGGRANHGFPK